MVSSPVGEDVQQVSHRLGPLLLIFHVNEVSEIINCATNIFADDTSILYSDDNHETK